MAITIKHQQEVANKILNTLECADPYAILAGGAPRDWYFNQVANDLDFYVHLPPATCAFESLRWERLGLSLTRFEGRTGLPDEYSCMEHLSRIYEGVEEGVKFQIMVMREATFKSVVPKFGASVCMAWWKGKEIRVEHEFELSHIFKCIFKKDDYTAKEKHISKMKNRYPDYHITSLSNLDTYVEGYCRKYNIYPTKSNVINHYKDNNNVENSKR